MPCCLAHQLGAAGVEWTMLPSQLCGLCGPGGMPCRRQIKACSNEFQPILSAVFCFLSRAGAGGPDEPGRDVLPQRAAAAHVRQPHPPTGRLQVRRGDPEVEVGG